MTRREAEQQPDYPCKLCDTPEDKCLSILFGCRKLEDWWQKQYKKERNHERNAYH